MLERVLQRVGDNLGADTIAPGERSRTAEMRKKVLRGGLGRERQMAKRRGQRVRW